MNQGREKDRQERKTRERKGKRMPWTRESAYVDSGLCHPL